MAEVDKVEDVLEYTKRKLIENLIALETYIKQKIVINHHDHFEISKFPDKVKLLIANLLNLLDHAKDIYNAYTSEQPIFTCIADCMSKHMYAISKYAFESSKLNNEKAKIYAKIHVWAIDTVKKLQDITENIEELSKFIDTIESYINEILGTKSKERMPVCYYLAITLFNIHGLTDEALGFFPEYSSFYSTLLSYIDNIINNFNEIVKSDTELLKIYDKIRTFRKQIMTGQVDGVVINEELAKRSPCECYIIELDGKKTDICFSKGIIGQLTEEQEQKYCPIRVDITEEYAKNNPVYLKAYEDLKKRLKEFIEASEECKRLARNIKDGFERLKFRIKCMKERLGRGK